MLTAINQVINVATAPTTTPIPIGFRYERLEPLKLEVTAVRTTTHSLPSRNTSAAISSTATRGFVWATYGSGFPSAVTPCQTRSAAITSAPTIKLVVTRG